MDGKDLTVDISEDLIPGERILLSNLSFIVGDEMHDDPLQPYELELHVNDKKNM